MEENLELIKNSLENRLHEGQIRIHISDRIVTFHICVRGFNYVRKYPHEAIISIPPVLIVEKIITEFSKTIISNFVRY